MEIAKPFPIVQSPGTDYYGMFSPDGKWVAYLSDESGRGEIYVEPSPGPGGMTGAAVSRTGKRWLFALAVGEPNPFP